MKKNMFILLVLFVLFVFPSNVKGICYNKDKIKLLKIASNISGSYDYFEANDTFNITLTNLRPGFIVYDSKSNATYNYSQEEITFQGYEPGKSYKFDIYAKLNNCDNEKLYSLYVTLPTLNKNYDDQLCVGLSDYDICQKWGNYVKDHEEFSKQINEIKKEFNNDYLYVEEAEYLGFFDHLMIFFVRYYYIILPVIIVGGIVTIYILNKQNKLF